MSVTLSSPVEIGPRLVPAVRIEPNHNGPVSFVSVEPWEFTDAGRVTWRYMIDARLGDRTIEYEGTDLSTPKPRFAFTHADYANALSTVLVFLAAFAESVDYYERTGIVSEHLDVFPDTLRDWALYHNDYFSLLADDIDETRD